MNLITSPSQLLWLVYFLVSNEKYHCFYLLKFFRFLGNILLKNIIKYYAQRKKQSLYQPKIVSNEVDVTDNGKTASQFSKNTVDKITILRQRVARASENLKSRFSPQKERTTPIQDESSEDDEYYAQKRGSTPQKETSPSPSERRYDKFERSMTPDIARVLRTEGIYSMNNNRV